MGIVQKSSIKNTLIAYAAIGIGYLNKLLLFTNFLTTEEVGFANIIIHIAALFAAFSGFGIITSILRYFPFFKDDKHKHNGFLFWTVAFSFVGFILFTLAFLILKDPIIFHYQEKSKLLTDYYYYIIPLGFSTLFFNVFESYLKSLFKTVFPTFVKEILLRLMITLSVSLYAFDLVNFHQFAIIYILANSVPALILMVYALAIGQLNLSPIVSPYLKTEYKKIVSFSLFSFLNNISAYLLLIIDSLMIAGMLGLGATGIYTTMIYLTSVFLVPSRSMNKITVPLVSQLWKNNDMDGMRSLYQKVSINNLIIGGLIFILIWVNMDFVFYFMPDDYKAGLYVFLFIAIGKIFTIYSGVNGAILSLSKKYRWDLLFTISLIALTIGTNYILIPIYGIKGAAIATCITLLLYNTIRILFVMSIFKLHPFTLKDIFIVILGAASIYIITLVPSFNNIFIDLIIKSTVGTVLFMGPIFILKLSPDINLLITNSLNKKG